MIQEFYNILLYLFEMAPSGSLWDLSLTNQLMALIQRYFFISNSTLTFMMITLLPIIMVTGTRILTYIGENLDKLLYVQIDVTENELIFTPINEYITKHFDGIAQLKKAKGITGYIKPLYTSQHASGLRISGGATGGLDAIPLVALIPRKYITNAFQTHLLTHFIINSTIAGF
jgi:hypothetical protein